MKVSDLYENQLLVDQCGKLWRVKSIFVSKSLGQQSAFVAGLLNSLSLNGPFEAEVTVTETRLSHFGPVPVEAIQVPATAKEQCGLKVINLRVGQILTDRIGDLWQVKEINIPNSQIEVPTFVAEMLDPQRFKEAIYVKAKFSESELANFERCATAIG